MESAMTNPYVLSAVANERIRDMHRAAERHHRATLARGTRPSWFAVARAGIVRVPHSTREIFRRSQLGPVAGSCATC
jgi:hypothetical protein